MRQFLLALGLTFAALACNQSEFSQDTTRKAAADKEKLSGDQVPGKPVDCTGQSEAQCHARKEEARTKDSFRDVDCSAKDKDACDEAIKAAKAQDGKENSQIRVTHCAGDAAASCEKLPLCDDAVKGACRVEDASMSEETKDRKKDKDIDDGGGDLVKDESAIELGDDEIEFGNDKLFHIGDGRFDNSSCRAVVNTFPLSGTRYTFEFKVLADNTKVTITIKRACGVDLVGSNVVTLRKDGSEIARKILTPRTEPFAFGTNTLKAGRYVLEVHSQPNNSPFSRGDADDFLIGNVNLKASGKIKAGAVNASN